MMRMKWGKIAPTKEIPGFGEAFLQRLNEKKNPEVHAASLFAWSLLAELLRDLGMELPEVFYSDTGKPYFANFPLHFSISHSGRLAAAMVSDAPCGVDLERVRPELSEKLYARCMHPAEIDAGLDFFEAWTKKECLAKLTGKGMPGRPSAINTLEYEGWHTERILDRRGQAYVLSAITEKAPKD
ncbi:MAG: 4'-phosphopantetheinyl transferase superfamily protein [Clostridia bacterium]|nr:4'-phosphopantetheinyl transferase superfamily protein [Clostridia bacterium]